MSRMNISQALQAALDAASREKDILTVRVLQDEKAAPALSARRVTLPLDGMAQLPFALGCAAAGLQTVLDLTALWDGARRLEAAFAETDRGARRPILMLLSDRYCPSLPGVKLVRPVNSLECAKAVIAALKSDMPTLILEDPLKAFELCEVPEEAFSGEPDAVEEEKTAEAIPVETIAEEMTRPEQTGFAAFPARIAPYDPAEIIRAAEKLGVLRDALTVMCCKAACDAEIAVETGIRGEIALLPPEDKDMRLWVGEDRIALCWKPDRVSSEEARQALKKVISFLELPLRLIMTVQDKA